MANHKSSKKRIRQSIVRNAHNRYYAKTMRNALKNMRATTDKAVAVELMPALMAMIDKLAKKNIIHDNKAGNLKSEIALHVNKL